MTEIRVAGKYGRLPNAGRPRVSLVSAHVPASYTPPPSLDRYSAIPAASLGMDGNNDVGDGEGTEGRMISRRWRSPREWLATRRVISRNMREEPGTCGACGRYRMGASRHMHEVLRWVSGFREPA